MVSRRIKERICNGTRYAMETSGSAKIAVPKKRFCFLTVRLSANKDKLNPYRTVYRNRGYCKNGNNPVHGLYSGHVTIGEYGNMM